LAAIHPGYFLLYTKDSENKSSCTSCDDIGGSSYQDKPGQTACIECGDNMARYAGWLDGSSSRSCQCKADYWRVNGTCTKCPLGATCTGFNVTRGSVSGCSDFPELCLPVAKPDFWTPLHRTQLQRVGVGSLMIDLYRSTESGSGLFFQCSPGRCQGGENSTCTDGCAGAFMSRRIGIMGAAARG
jgi:hypothetical protein